MEASNDTSTSSSKTGLESLSREELIAKYKSLLNIAKKAKQAKDEFAAENLLLKEALQRNETQKEADKNALLTMKETLEEFTEQKLLLSTQLDELRQQNRQDKDLISQLSIENESLRRQMVSLTTDNESLLNDIDAMETKLKKVNTIGIEQKKHLELLEIEVNRLKERESHTASLEQRLQVSSAENKALKETENLLKRSLNDLTEKYQHVKEINTQQRHKFNSLKERFVDVHRKLTKLKECKRILLETQQEYAEAVSKWQNEIINGARQLCQQLHSLKAENEELLKQLKAMNVAGGNIEQTNNFQNAMESEDKIDDLALKMNIEVFAAQLTDLENLANQAAAEEKYLTMRMQRGSEKESEKSVEFETNDDVLLKKLEISEKALLAATQKCDHIEKQMKAYEISNSKLQNDCENFKTLLREHELKLTETESTDILAANAKLEADLMDLNEKLAEKNLQCEKLANEVTTNSEVNEAASELQQQFEELEACLAIQTQDYEEIRMEKLEIENENQFFKERANNFEKEIAHLKASLQALGSEKASLFYEIKEKMQINEDLLRKLKNLEKDFENLKENSAQKEEEHYQATLKLKTELQSECEHLRIQLEQQCEVKIKQSEEILNENSKLTADLRNLKEYFAEKMQQQEKMGNQITVNEQMSQASEELQARFTAQKQDYEKLLIEKSEIESSKQFLMEKLELQTEKLESLESAQDTKEKLNTDLKQTTQELQKLRQLYDELQARHEVKEREHTDLLGEMRELNEALKKRGDLISRQEARQNELNAELKRLQQFEQILKEKEHLIQQKDDELKQINEEVKSSQAKVEELTAACSRSEQQFHVLTLELQSLRNSNSELKDDAQSDTISVTSTMSRAESINQLRDVDDSYEERYTKLKTLAMKLKKKLQEQTASANELSTQLKARETALEAQQKLNESLTSENKKLKSTRKQSNMLNLEIEAAEKSLSDVSAKLTAKSGELNELKAVLETKESSIVQLRKELAIVEAAKAAECDHAKELKAQIDLLQAQIKDAVHSKQTTLDSNKDLERAQESLKLEIEDLHLQLSQSESKQALKIEALTTENTQLQDKLIEMEAALAAAQQKLKSTERGLDELRVEHTEYKLKVQTVLRKQQTKDTSHERELQEELLSVRQQLQQTETLTQELRQKLEAGDKQFEILTDDNASLLQRKEELVKLIEELKLQNEALLQEQRTLLQAQQDALRQQRQQIQNLDECHKAQTERLEHNYQQQLKQLQAELAKASATMRPAPLIGAVAKSTPPKILSELLHPNEAHLMEREDAEGSESANVITLQSLAAAKRKISNSSSSTTTQRRRSLHELMPLDELLNAPMNALNSETVFSPNNKLVSSSYLDDDGSNGNTSLNMTTANDSVEHLELQAAKERLQIQESRVRHLTALLAENEQDLAKLTQMNDMLKEELRRQERSVEREQHMHNSEYLKNVIIKFITLNNVDERTRLVPVLNTILRLSRAETEMLNCVAKGQKVAENSRGWSSFLPSWGGGGGGGNNGNSN